MYQILDITEWRSIRFGGIDLPQSLMGISILIVIDDFTERTGDWIWSLPHCKGMEKNGCSQWCLESAAEIVDYLIGNRGAVLAIIQERLGPHGFDPVATFAEWIFGLSKIQEIASNTDGNCSWIAEISEYDAKLGLERAMRYLDSLDSKMQ